MDQPIKDTNAPVPPSGPIPLPGNDANLPPAMPAGTEQNMTASPSDTNNPASSMPASGDQNAMTTSVPALTPQDLYMKMGELGMQAEQKQFEQDMIQLQASLAGKGDDMMNHYAGLQKKGIKTSAIGTAAGAIAGGLAGLLFSGGKPNWGRAKKGAVTAGGSIVGAGVAGALTRLPMRKQMAALQQQAAELEAAQNNALQEILNKYTVLVQERLGNNSENIMNPVLPEEPGKPVLPESQLQNKAGNTEPATLLHNATASPLHTHTRSVL